MDQSTVKTGFSIFENGNLITYSIVDLASEKDLLNRFHLMCKELHALITHSSADILVFEDVSLQTNAATLTALARIQGAIIQSSLLCNTPYKIYKPPSWRKILGFNQGYGIVRKELKRQAFEYVEKNYNIKTKEDIAESICIGSAFLIDNGGIINAQ